MPESDPVPRKRPKLQQKENSDMKGIEDLLEVLLEKVERTEKKVDRNEKALKKIQLSRYITIVKIINICICIYPYHKTINLRESSALSSSDGSSSSKKIIIPRVSSDVCVCLYRKSSI